jgi:hypothetical protein
VTSDNKGFAVDLFELLARLMVGGPPRINPERCDLREIGQRLSRGDRDIIVSAIVPTFRRGNDMLFSTTFPFLRVPLSAVIHERDRQRVSVDDILAFEKPNAPPNPDIRLLVVEGEVGEEFVRNFLPGINLEDSAQVKKTSTMNPEDLYKQLIDPAGSNVLLADMATCYGVSRVLREQTPIKPIEDKDDLWKEFSRKVEGSELPFPTLALYPIAFALRKDDWKWKDMLDLAFKSLMFEGMRSLGNLYHEYATAANSSFLLFWQDDDETIPYRNVRDWFRRIKKQPGSKTKSNSAATKKGPGMSKTMPIR